MTHATDSDTNAERDFVMAELRDSGVIGETTVYQEGDRLEAGKANHCVTDGVVGVVELTATRKALSK